MHFAPQAVKFALSACSALSTMYVTLAACPLPLQRALSQPCTGPISMPSALTSPTLLFHHALSPFTMHFAFLACSTEGSHLELAQQLAAHAIHHHHGAAAQEVGGAVAPLLPCPAGC